MGDYSYLHPLQDVNAAQSTNDVYPTAIKIALDSDVGQLVTDLDVLREALEAKEIGRAHV